MAEHKAVGAQQGEVGSREGMRLHRVNSEPILKEEMLARGGEWVFRQRGIQQEERPRVWGTTEVSGPLGSGRAGQAWGAFKWAADSLVPS